MRSYASFARVREAEDAVVEEDEPDGLRCCSRPRSAPYRLPRQVKAGHDVRDNDDDALAVDLSLMKSAPLGVLVTVTDGVRVGVEDEGVGQRGVQNRLDGGGGRSLRR